MSVQVAPPTTSALDARYRGQDVIPATAGTLSRAVRGALGTLSMTV